MRNLRSPHARPGHFEQQPSLGGVGRNAILDERRAVRVCAYRVPKIKRPDWGSGHEPLILLVGMAGFEPTTP